MTHTQRAQLANAFKATDYFVQNGAGWQRINIDNPCPDTLSKWLAAHCTGPCAWLVTACNPGAEPSDEPANRQRDAALRACLDAAGHRYAAADSRALDGRWPNEPGVCVVDMDEGLARALALRFGQAAFVAVPVDGPVQLLWTEP